MAGTVAAVTVVAVILGILATASSRRRGKEGTRRCTMRKLARFLRRSRVQLLQREYDALCAFGEQAGKALEVGQDVATRLETLMKVLVPGEYE